jgi:DNA polymerase-3 subunit alpha
MTTIAPKRVIVFDVETSGLLPKNPCKQFPHILQLSYIVYDMSTCNIEKKYNAYIKVADDVVITDEITELTGITREKCDEDGIPILEALYAMYLDYTACDCLIAHNLKFDSIMIGIELERHDAPTELRNLMNQDYEKKTNKIRYCTMMHSVELCAIRVDAINKKGEPFSYNKWPKLSELHTHFFGFIPKGLHDSLVDVEVCLKCYLKLQETASNNIA